MDTASAPLRGVIFDWAGVFCSPGEPFSHPGFKEYTGLSIDELTRETKDLQGKYYRGLLSTTDFWQGVIAQFQLPLRVDELSKAYLASYRIYPEMLRLADTVRAHTKTALLSNLTPEMMEEIVRTHFVDQHFDHVLFSNEIGYMKPEPESFAAALERLGTLPHETLFIDDSETNVAAAQKLGLCTIHFVSPETCAQKVSSLVGFEV
jgi:HAD superfamily hydrolase (TIGR01509 family)